MSCTLGGKFSSLLLSWWCIGAQSTGPTEWDQNNSIRLAEISFQAVCRPLSTAFASVRIPHNALGPLIDSSQLLSGGVHHYIPFFLEVLAVFRCASVAFTLRYYHWCVWVSSSVSTRMRKCRCFYTTLIAGTVLAEQPEVKCLTQGQISSGNQGHTGDHRWGEDRPLVEKFMEKER